MSIGRSPVAAMDMNRGVAPMTKSFNRCNCRYLVAYPRSQSNLFGVVLLSGVRAAESLVLFGAQVVEEFGEQGGAFGHGGDADVFAFGVGVAADGTEAVQGRAAGGRGEVAV